MTLSEPVTRKHVAIVGGGVTGLSCALKLCEEQPSWQVTLLEGSDRIGGVLGTTRRDGFLIERSADMFTVRDPWAIDLCKRIGFESELIEPTLEHQRAYLVHRGKLTEVPGGFSLMSPNRVWPVLTTPILSWRGKLRLAWEYFTPARKDGADESLASFARRRLGPEVYERLVQPLIGGIYTADPEMLSMAATMDSFLEMERRHGGLIRGSLKKTPAQKQAAKTASGARYRMFRAPKEGMGALVEAMATQLPPECVRLNSLVAGLRRKGDRWRMSVNDSDESFDGVILCTPGGVTAKILSEVDGELADEVGQITRASAAVVMLGYERSQFERLVNGFGFVAPSIERRKIIAGSFASVKFAGRAPDGKLLLRVFVGGALQPELLELPDEQIVALVESELKDLLGATGSSQFAEVVRWNDVMPQYHVGHRERVQRIEARVAQCPGLELAGNSYRGVGIPMCVKDGERAATAIGAELSAVEC